MKATRPKTPITLECSQEEAEMIAFFLQNIQSSGATHNMLQHMLLTLKGVGIEPTKRLKLMHAANCFFVDYEGTYYV